MTPADKGRSRAVGQTGARCCVPDPYADVPAHLRPQPKKEGTLRQVTCPSCGKEYRTNRGTDLCLDCERSRARKTVSPE